MSVWEVKAGDKVEYVVSEIGTFIGDENSADVDFIYRESRKKDVESKKCIAHLPRTLISELSTNGGIYDSKEELKKKLIEIKERVEKEARYLTDAIPHLS